ncbi:hypothetical protein [Ideonella sp.]|uniref:hypothetical protein n=1 Tax=Ideonella sp. TaxID=1929293 RepID=UPI002B47BF82|nr:hypothetical protein [Ideonella sp.]HJV67677.1 hypothetical protein [Ideonella sp.]
MATVFSGAPSTVYAFASGGSALEATFAAGRMLIDSNSPWALFAAAALVHGSVSAFWAGVAGMVLPRRHTAAWAIAFAAAVGMLDLRVIAPIWFPHIAALAFWPQMADHLMWGACLGGTLQAAGRLRSLEPRC